MLGVYYPGQAYPGRAPAYPAILYTPTYYYRATVPQDLRTIAVSRERRTVIVPRESRAASTEPT